MLIPFALLAPSEPLDGVTLAAAAGILGMAYYLTNSGGLLLIVVVSLSIPAVIVPFLYQAVRIALPAKK